MCRWVEYRPENEWTIAVSDSQLTYYAVIDQENKWDAETQREAVQDYIDTYQYIEGNPEALKQEIHWVLIDPEGTESKFRGYYNRYGGFVAAY